MKTIVVALLVGLVVVSCGSDDSAAISDATSIPAPGAETTAAPTVVRYEVTLAVDYHGYTRIVAHGGIPTDYRLTYTVESELLAGDGGNSEEHAPTDASVVWARECYSGIMGPDIELLSESTGSTALVIPDSLDLVPHPFAERLPDVDWLAPPATSLSSLSGVVALLHRLPSTLSLGDDANCGEPGPKVVILGAGSAWMTANTVSFGGEMMSRAARRNLVAGSEDPQYVIDGDGEASGWVIQLVSPQLREGEVVPVSFTREESDELGGWELSIEGEIRPIG